MKIAVIGAGVSGLGAAWLLARAGHEVEIWEAEGTPGGHATTVEVDGTPVDIGFIVYNEHTYPNLIALFAELGVPTKASDMSFGVSLRGGALEYAGDDANRLFAQRRNLLRPSFHSMWLDILRFYREAPELLADEGDATVSLGAYLERSRYSRAFIRDHVLPMGAAIWSTTSDEMLNFPARSFVRFFVNHGLFRLKDRFIWRTVAGGSRAYVHRLIAAGPVAVRLGTAAATLRRLPDGVELRDGTGALARFDHAVVATHAPQALALLADADEAERDVLGAFRTTANTALLHDDPTQMPQQKLCWSSWNYLGDGVASQDGGGGGRVAVTYWMNRLQALPGRDLFVTLNPLTPPDPARVILTRIWHHPLFDGPAIAAQGRLGTIQGRRRTWFCGAWMGFGFHEDGLTAGLAVAEALGGQPRPWPRADVSPAGMHALAGYQPVRERVAA